MAEYSAVSPRPAPAQLVGRCSAHLLCVGASNERMLQGAILHGPFQVMVHLARLRKQALNARRSGRLTEILTSHARKVGQPLWAINGSVSGLVVVARLRSQGVARASQNKSSQAVVATPEQHVSDDIG